MNASGLPGGVYAPVLTPFQNDLSADADLFVRYCKWLTIQGARLAVFGTNSEANSLSVDERIELLDRLVDAGVAPERMMPGTGACALPDAVRLTSAAVAHGACGVLMLPPFYYKNNSDEGLYRAYAEVIERVGDQRLRICLYHIPQISGVPITLGLIERLVRDFPAIVCAIKDSSGDWANTQSVLDAFPDFAVFPGSDVFLLQGLRAGSAGCISATANINAHAINDVYVNWMSNDADDRQLRLNAVRKVIEGQPMIPALKHIIGHFGQCPSFARVRPPLVELDREQGASVVSALDETGFSAHDLQIALSPQS